MAGLNRIFKGNKSKSRIHFIAIWPKKGKKCIISTQFESFTTPLEHKIAWVKKTHFSLMHAGLNDLRTIQK